MEIWIYPRKAPHYFLDIFVHFYIALKNNKKILKNYPKVFQSKADNVSKSAEFDPLQTGSP